MPRPVETTPLGPLASALCVVALALNCFIGFGVIAVTPVLVSVPVLGLAVGGLLLSPRTAIERITLPAAWLIFVFWVLLSTTWTLSPATAEFFLKRDLAVWITFALLGGLISADEVKAGLVWFGRITVVVSLGAVAAFADSRTHIDPAGLADDYPGWHGLFDHKNVMTPVLVMIILATWVGDRNKLTRSLTILGAVVLLAGSTSVTGFAAAGISIAMLTWLNVLHGVDGRRTAAFVVTSAALVLATVVGIVASLSEIVRVAGRDLTFTGRTDIWSATIDMVIDRPVVGYGLGGLFSNPATSTTDQVNAAIGFDVPHAHNGILDLVAQLGFIGGALFALAMLSLMISSIRVRVFRPDIGGLGAGVAATLILVGQSEAVFGGAWLGFIGLLTATNLGLLNDQRRRRDRRALAGDAS